MKYDTILFDFDGTLADSSNIILPCVDITYEKLGLKVPPRSILNKFIGPPLHDSFRIIGMPDELLDRAVEIYREQFNTINFNDMQLFSGMDNLLKTLKISGVNLAISSVRVEDKLQDISRQMNLTRFFDVICGRVGEEGVLSKADVVRRALNRLGSPSGKTVLVGDSKFDEEGAAETGIDFIAVMYGFGYDTRADIEKSVFIADSVRELAEFLMNF